MYLGIPYGGGGLVEHVDYLDYLNMVYGVGLVGCSGGGVFIGGCVWGCVL